jgi:FliG N-terminal domain
VAAEELPYPAPPAAPPLAPVRAVPQGGSLAEMPSVQVPGPRKAAVLMAALGSERAAAVIQRLRDDEVERLSVEMARLPVVGDETTQLVLHEVAATGSSARATPSAPPSCWDVSRAPTKRDRSPSFATSRQSASRHFCAASPRR